MAQNVVQHVNGIKRDVQRFDHFVGPEKYIMFFFQHRATVIFAAIAFANKFCRKCIKLVLLNRPLKR